MKRLVVAVSLTIPVIAMTPAASASWLASGSAKGTGHTAHLVAPTVATANVLCDNGSGATNGKVQFRVTSWTAGASGTTPTSYNMYVDGSSTAPGATGLSTTYASGFFTPTRNHTYSLQMTSKAGRWESTTKSTAHTIVINNGGNCSTIA